MICGEQTTGAGRSSGLPVGRKKTITFIDEQEMQSPNVMSFSVPDPLIPGSYTIDGAEMQQDVSRRTVERLESVMYVINVGRYSRQGIPRGNVPAMLYGNPGWATSNTMNRERKTRSLEVVICWRYYVKNRIPPTAVRLISFSSESWLPVTLKA